MRCACRGVLVYWPGGGEWVGVCFIQGREGADGEEGDEEEGDNDGDGDVVVV